MEHILDLYKASENGEYLSNLNQYLEDSELSPLNYNEFEKFIEKNQGTSSFGEDTVGFIYQPPQITGFNSENVGCKQLCDNSDSEISKEMNINDESTSEEWEKYYEATTTARCSILDTIADYAVLVEKNDVERTFVMLNSWFDPIFSKTYPIDMPIYDLVW